MSEFQESKLGTLEYWQQVYQQEITNFKEFNDEGQVWFGQEAADKMVNYVKNNIKNTAKIIDLGCGNGHLLFHLFSLGYENIMGVDYSVNCIELAKEICNSQGMDIPFKVLDILNDDIDLKCDLLMDKGTLDAISLSDKSNSPIKKYVENCAKMLNDEGKLIITSCNWTREELLQMFGESFVYVDELKHPVFKFGGVQGQTITTIIIQKI